MKRMDSIGAASLRALILVIGLVAGVAGQTASATAASPRQAGIVNHPAASAAGSSLSITGSVGSLPGATSVVTVGHYAYVADYGRSQLGSTGGLSVVDIADPAHPVTVGSTMDPRLAGADGVFVVGHYAYIAATNSNSLVIVDVSDPAAPLVVGAVRDDILLNEAYTVFVAGSYAYVAAQGNCTSPCAAGNVLTILNVSNPAAPTIVGHYQDITRTDHATSVYVVGSKAYLTAFHSYTVTVVNVADPASPTLSGSLTTSSYLPYPNDIWVDSAGHYAYVANQAPGGTGRLTVLDVSGTNPVVVGSVASSTQLSGAYWVTVVGHDAFVAAAGNDALTVVDVNQPATPSIVDSISSSSLLHTATGVFVNNGQAYVSAYNSDALTAVDVGAYVTGVNHATPTTSITSGPGTSTTSTAAPFTFSATEQGSPLAAATFECRLDGGDWKMCASPASYAGLAPGSHTFAVRATDQQGNVDPNPATYMWTVTTAESTPPPPSSGQTKPYAATPLKPHVTKKYGRRYLIVHVSGGYRVPASLRAQHVCSDRVVLTLRRGRRILKTTRVVLTPRCTYRATIRVRRVAVGHARSLSLTIHLNATKRLSAVTRKYVLRLRRR